MPSKFGRKDKKNLAGSCTRFLMRIESKNLVTLFSLVPGLPP